MYWKEEHGGAELKSGEFLKKKFREFAKNSCEILNKPGPRGVTTSKVEEIISNIGPLIPKVHIKFWKDLPRNESSKDLTINYDHLERTEKKTNTSNSPLRRASERNKEN